jgi:hypothetical protein
MSAITHEGQGQEVGEQLRYDASELTAMRNDVRSMAEGMKTLTEKVTYLSGQLSVKCPFEAERISQIEGHIKEVRGEVTERTNSLSNRIWGIAAGVVMIVLAAALAVAMDLKR